MNLEKLKDISLKMQIFKLENDHEKAHDEADKLLIETLKIIMKKLSLSDANEIKNIIKNYEKITKWYS
ncbi:MAG: hypothetical protein ACTSR3_01095 [Candidatus Helarchaeota archaeon]